MSDLSIRNDFIEGINEIFSSLYNEGKDPEDGIQFYAFSGGEDNIYQETKFKKYKKPITLISSVRESKEDGDTDIKAQKRKASFKVPLKNLITNGIESMDKDTVSQMRKGLIKYKDTLYEINKIEGNIFIENIYTLWEFQCTEVFDPDSILLEIEEEPENLNLAINEEDF